MLITLPDLAVVPRYPRFPSRYSFTNANLKSLSYPVHEQEVFGVGITDKVRMDGSGVHNMVSVAQNEKN